MSWERPSFALIMRPRFRASNPLVSMSLQRISFVREVLQGLCLVLLIVIPSVLYARTLAFDFVNWDDDLYVYANAVIRGFSWEHFWVWMTRPFVSLYVPVTMASYALNYSLSGLDPGSFHAWNAALHAVNTLLVFFVFYSFRRDIYVCFLAALIFAVHPVQVEAAAWISQRKTVLMAFFSLAGFFLFIHGYFASEKRRLLLTLACVCFVLAVLSKPTAVMIPLMLAAYHHFFKEDGGAARRFVLPYLLALPCFAAAAATLSFYPRSTDFLMSGELLTRILPLAGAMVFYTGLVINPRSLDLRYPEDLTASFAGQEWLLGLGLLVSSLVLLLLWIRRKKSGFWACWYILFLLPAAQIVPSPAGDRHVYLALVGLLGILITVPARFRVMLLAFLGIWAVSLIPIMSERLNVWQNSETLWKNLRYEGPFRISAEVQLAAYYEEAGRFQEASRVYQQVLQRRPHVPYPYVNAFNMYTRLGDQQKAQAAAVLFESNYSKTHRLQDVYRELLRLKADPAALEQFMREVMRKSLFGIPGEANRA